MNNAEMIDAVRASVAKRQGVPVDRYGHVRFKKNNRDYRFKFMKNVIRYEVLVRHEHGSPDWVRIQSYPVKTSYANLKKKGLLVD